MRSRLLAATVTALAATALTTACDDAPEAAQPPPSPQVQPLALTPCTDLPDLPTAECGTITVPLDRANPGAGTTTVAFARVPRTDQSQPPLGTIVPNPGGPGTSTIDFAGPLYAQGLAPVLDRRDLLLVDPRGTGRSTSLTCDALADPALALAGLDERRAAIGECGEQLGDRSAQHSTTAVADDIDDIRAGLGIDELDLFGDSYGTFLMATYAQRHPERTASAVLSGAYSVTERTEGAMGAAALRRAITLVCERTRRCDGPTALADLAALATTLRATPSTVDVEVDGVKQQVPLDEWQLAGAVGKAFSSTPDPELQVGVAAAASAARTGDLAPIRALVSRYLTTEVATAAAGVRAYAVAADWAVSCHDYPEAFAGGDDDREAAYERGLAALDDADFAPFSARAWSTRGSYDSGACLKWPHAPSQGTPFEAGAPMPNAPVLVLSGDLDANTPVEAGRQAAAQFPNAEVVEIRGAGHTPSVSEGGMVRILEFYAAR